MRVNQKYVEVGLIVVMALVIYLAYSFGYQNYVEKAKTTETECDTIQSQINDLTAKSAMKSEWEQQIEESDSIIDAILAKYGPGNTPEKSLVMVVDLCKKIGCSVSSVSFGENNLIYESTVLDENEVPKNKLYKSSLSLSVSAGYTQMKKIMDYINSNPERMNVDSFNLSYDQATGKLSAGIIMNLFAVEDANHHYVAPVIEDIEIGNENLFKSYEEPVVEEELEGEEGDAENTPAA